MAQPRLVLAREDRLPERLEQGRHAARAVGQRPRRDRQALACQPGRDTAAGPHEHEALVQDKRPHAGPEGRAGEQPRRRRRRHLGRRGGAVASPAPARADDPPPVRLHLDFDDFRVMRAVGDAGLAAAGTGPRVLRRVHPFLLLLEVRPGRAAMAGRPGPLAAPAPRRRPRPLLALAAEQRSRHRGPARTKLVVPRLERRDPVAQIARLRLQGGVLHGRDMTVERFRASTPASARSLPSRATSFSSARARFAVRRTFLTSSRAAFSFARFLSTAVSRLLARCRARTSLQRRSSQRASAASARASASSARTRSRSQRNSRSTGPGADAAGRDDERGPSSATSGTDEVPESSMRISMRDAIPCWIRSYQCQICSDRNDVRTDRRHRSTERLRSGSGTRPVGPRPGSSPASAPRPSPGAGTTTARRTSAPPPIGDRGR